MVVIICAFAKIHSILPKIQANVAGAGDAVILDLDGYVCGTNSANIFMVDDEGVLLTPHVDYCLPGIVRGAILTLAEELGIPCAIRRVALAEVHAASEVFTTGTVRGLIPVTMIDGRVIGDGVSPGKITKRLQDVYAILPERPGWATEVPPFAQS
jgi:branched-subunit amino acid aminotransferase/4-amino-4-deoxychorismate lyase